MKCNAAHYLMSAAAEIMLLAVLQWLLVVFPTKKSTGVTVTFSRSGRDYCN